MTEWDLECPDGLEQTGTTQKRPTGVIPTNQYFGGNRALLCGQRKTNDREKKMRSFWMTFKERGAGCVEAKDEQAAAAIAKEITGFDAESIKDLPYPAEPRINKYEDPKYGVCPSFCFAPKQCCGRTSCPQRYSCTE